MADFGLFLQKNLEHTFFVARNPIKIRCSNTDFFIFKKLRAKLKSIYAIIYRLPGFVLYYHSPLFCTGLSDLFDPIQITIHSFKVIILISQIKNKSLKLYIDLYLLRFILSYLL